MMMGFVSRQRVETPAMTLSRAVGLLRREAGSASAADAAKLRAAAIVLERMIGASHDGAVGRLRD